MALPIFCRKDKKWKEELEQSLQSSESVTLLALGDVRYEVLHYLLHKQDIDISQLTTKKMKNKEKGLGLKVKVRSRFK